MAEGFSAFGIQLLPVEFPQRQLLFLCFDADHGCRVLHMRARKNVGAQNIRLANCVFDVEET
jgi:hypothetical protein